MLSSGNSSNPGSNQLPVSEDQILANMQAAVPSRRMSTSGIVYARFDHKTGDFVYGKNPERPFPMDHTFAAPWSEFKWGYKGFQGRTVVDAKMIPVAAGPQPMPATPYTEYGVDGPKACLELQLSSMTEPGFTAIYSCLNVSGQSRMLDLWAEIVAQYQVNREFANPVFNLAVDYYDNAYGRTFVLTYPVSDWVSRDGTMFSTIEDQEALPFS